MTIVLCSASCLLSPAFPSRIPPPAPVLRRTGHHPLPQHVGRPRHRGWVPRKATTGMAAVLRPRTAASVCWTAVMRSASTDRQPQRSIRCGVPTGRVKYCTALTKPSASPRLPHACLPEDAYPDPCLLRPPYVPPKQLGLLLLPASIPCSYPSTHGSTLSRTPVPPPPDGRGSYPDVSIHSPALVPSAPLPVPPVQTAWALYRH